MDEPLSLYLHIPFCTSRCTYCDFNSFAGMKALIPEYVDALKQEIRINRDLLLPPNPVHSIYFGGGTPSIMESEEISSVLQTIREVFSVQEDVEITLEMNPGDADSEYIDQLKLAGINRISLGMQSVNPDELKLMGRRHTPEKSMEAAELLKSAGLHNFSLDLIYGFPTQTMNSWQASLQTAVSLNPAHISLYALSIEEGTFLQKRINEGKLLPADEDITVEMYHYAEAFLEEKGFIHYEISNWAQDLKYQSRHNTQYWLTQSYLGLGAGAHGNIDHVRTINTNSIQEYLENMQLAKENKFIFPAANEIIPQTELMEMQDFVMLGLRLLQTGAEPDRFRERFGVDIDEVFHHEIENLLRRKLIEYGKNNQLLLKKESILISNQVFIEFV